MSHAETPPQATPGLSSLKLPPRLNVTLGTPAATLTTPMLPSMGIAAALDPPRIPDLLPPPVEPDSARALVDRSSFFKASPSGLARRSLSSIWNVEEFSEDLEVSPTKPTKRLDDAVPAPAPPPPPPPRSDTHTYARRARAAPPRADEAPSLFKSIGDAAARWSLAAAPEPPPPPEEEDAEVAWTVGTPPTRSAFLSRPAAARVYASPTREESHFPDRGDPNAPWVRSLLQAELESYQLSPGAAPPQPPPEARSLAEAASARSDLQSPSLLDKLLGYMPTPSAFVCVGQKHDGDGLRPGDRARSRSEPFPLDDAPSRPLETSAPVAIPGDEAAPQKARRKKPPPLDTSRSPTSPARLPRAASSDCLGGLRSPSPPRLDAFRSPNRGASASSARATFDFPPQRPGSCGPGSAEPQSRSLDLDRRHLRRTFSASASTGVAPTLSFSFRGQDLVGALAWLAGGGGGGSKARAPADVAVHLNVRHGDELAMARSAGNFSLQVGKPVLRTARARARLPARLWDSARKGCFTETFVCGMG